MRLAVLGGLLACVAFGQRIERHELRPAADGLRLYVTIDGVDRLISTRATRAWQGYTPQTLVYAERTGDGLTPQRLRFYDSFTRNSHTIDTDDLEFTEVTSVRLTNGDYALLIALRDPATKTPYVEMATPKGGVFDREQFAAFGTAANDFVEIRRYAPADLAAKRGDLSLLSPETTTRAPLRPGAVPNAAGMYEATLPAADAGPRTVTLNLRPGGVATLITTVEGKGAPVAVQGSWAQAGANVTLTTGDRSLVWTLGANGLTPRSWDRKEWGATGLPMRRVLSSR